MVNCRFENPFGTIESAQEYMTLLADAVLEAKHDVEVEIGADAAPRSSRQVDALRVVLYSLNKLDHHVQVSRRMLNDLRSLRRLMWQERAEEALSKPPGSSVLIPGGASLSAEPDFLACPPVAATFLNEGAGITRDPR
jgi:hypothetical protein